MSAVITASLASLLDAPASSVDSTRSRNRRVMLIPLAVAAAARAELVAMVRKARAMPAA